MILITENKLGYRGTLSVYQERVRQHLLQNTSDVETSDVRPFPAGGLNGILQALIVRRGQEHILYYLAVLESKTRLYQFVFWTAHDRQKKFEPKVYAVLDSFRAGQG
jgi:hypothetical protein